MERYTELANPYFIEMDGIQAKEEVRQDTRVQA